MTESVYNDLLNTLLYVIFLAGFFTAVSFAAEYFGWDKK